MTVYVDDTFIPATVGRTAARWCHLTADSDDELHEFAERLGLHYRLFHGNHRRPHTNHYDVTEEMRSRAIALGAVEEPWREGVVRRRRRASPPAPPPEPAG